MPTILGANTLSSGYDVANSLRFNDGSSDYLYKTFGTATNRKKWTFSAWVKRTNPSSAGEAIFGGLSEDSTSWYSRLADNGDGRFDFTEYSGSAYTINLRPNAIQSDPSAWYHFVLMYDSAQSTASNRVKYYINGSQLTSFATEVYPSQNQESGINKNHLHRIGQTSESGSSYYFDGYMAEVVFCDGQAYSPTDFGEFDEDSPTIWKPKDVSGLTFGNNGFYLDFENSSSLGADVSGNGNNFSVNNLTSADQTTDTCTNNFATMNPLDNYFYNAAFSEGNLKLVQPGSTECYTTSTIAMPTGKWYWEVKITASGSSKEFVGIADTRSTASDFTPYSGNSQVISYYGNNGHAKAGSTSTDSSYGDTFGAGDIIGVALDLVNDKIYFSKNGTFQNSGDPTSGSTGTGALAVPASPKDEHWYAQFSNIHNTESTFEINFGNPTFSISSGNSDGNGYGNFEYAVPSGYYSLNTKNLAEFG